ncbi:MAG: copper chaperone PCu(A)C [Alphaproteobacteria bacterium]|nr:copper chaperone PCu(A)C [Alphaproteobacteria bacterium]
MTPLTPSLGRFAARFAALSLALALALALASPAAIAAGDKPHGAMSPAAGTVKSGIKVSAAWARASAGRARNGAAYFTVVNNGAAADRLIGAETGIAKRAELHSHRMAGGVMRMRRVEGGIALRPGASLSFAPRGDHVMLMGLKTPLKAGESFPLTLIFEGAGRIRVTIPVRAIGAGAPKPHHE